MAGLWDTGIWDTGIWPSEVSEVPTGCPNFTTTFQTADLDAENNTVDAKLSTTRVCE